MKKEILDKIEEFKNLELKLVVLIQEDTTKAEQYQQQLEELRNARQAWLLEIGGGYEGLSNEKTAELYRLIHSAESSMVSSTINTYQLIDYIKRSQESKTLSMRDYDRCVDDLAQLEFLAETRVRSNVSALVKFCNKRNRKNFLSDIVCKFKKSKVQEKSEEKESK